MDDASKIIEQMRAIFRYFVRNAEHNALFIPERDAAEQILHIIDLEKAEEIESGKIAAIVSSVDATNHYNGSGWLDFKMHINGWAHENGKSDIVKLQNKDLS